MTDHDNICLLYGGTDIAGQTHAVQLAESLSLPFVDTPENPFRLHLVYTGNRLELQYNPFLVRQKQHPVVVDFLHNSSIDRRIATFTASNPLARAVGVKPNHRPTVIDATAGFGMDGLCLAWIGCPVLLFERNPVVHALLEDGLRRAGQNRELAQVIQDRITLCRGDSTATLADRSLPGETIFLDPMYPGKDKRALSRKEMRIIRQLVGDDADHTELFESALATGSKRIAVKRPKGAPPIAPHPPPSFSVGMKSGRFDVYITNHL